MPLYNPHTSVSQGTDEGRTGAPGLSATIPKVSTERMESSQKILATSRRVSILKVWSHDQKYKINLGSYMLVARTKPPGANRHCTGREAVAIPDGNRTFTHGRILQNKEVISHEQSQLPGRRQADGKQA